VHVAFRITLNTGGVVFPALLATLNGSTSAS
jgi:hypothetical protein